MGKKIRVALVTWLGTGNYGTSLQSYALHEVLRQLGYDVVFLHPFVIPGISHKWFRRWFKMEARKIRMRIRSLLPSSVKDNRLKKFNAENYNHCYVNGRAGYSRLLSETDVFVTGSDQIWNCVHCFDPFMFLDFAGKGKRMAYASSIGVSRIPEQYEEVVRAFLSLFQHIGTREKSAVALLSSLLGRNDIRQVLDPTFLLPAAHWETFAGKGIKMPGLPEKYLLCYLIGHREEYACQIERVRAGLGIKDVVFLPSLEGEELVLEHSTTDSAAGPYDFVRYIADAEAVCTDSFHACAIAINLSKNFVVLKRFDDADGRSQNDRIYDLLSLFGLSARWYDEAGEEWKRPVAYADVQKRLQEERVKSINYLVQAIEN